MINLAEQLVTMICVEHIDHQRIKLNDTYKNHARNMKTITQQNNQNQNLKLKN